MRQLFLAAAVLFSAVLGSSSESSAQNVFFAILSGAFVCNTPRNADPPLCRKGDLDASGSATLFVTGPTNLCVTIIVDNLNVISPNYPTGAHLHIGQASYSGPVLLQLPVPKNNGGGNPGTSMACFDNFPADTLTQLRANPEYFYIDIHAEGLQFGALRGQLF